MSSRTILVLTGVALCACARAVPQPLDPTPTPGPAPAEATFDEGSLQGGSADSLRDTARLAASSGGDSSVSAAANSAVADAVPSLPGLPLDEYAGKDRVAFYLKRFSGEAHDHVSSMLSQGTKYDAMIREKLRAGGIPEDFTYLALIESGYDPDDYSSVGAVGMWQFMTSTARDVGLRVDWWVDERRDPVRETSAAVKFLGNLRDQFGSLYLAAAAYNGGPGRVSRGLSHLALDSDSSEPDDKFFALASGKSLRAETREYVPQLIAAALIGREPGRYGFTVDTLQPFVYDSVPAPSLTGLRAVALSCNTDVATIGGMNGQILRGMTPPDTATVWLRVPRGCADGFHDAFAALDDSVRLGAAWRAVKKGETPALVAKKSGITVTTLRRYNPKLKTAAQDPIRSGTELLIPALSTVKAARDVPDPSIERYGVAVDNVYVVKKGDTLGKIAERNNTTVAALKRANHLKGDVLQIGQKLRIRG